MKERVEKKRILMGIVLKKIIYILIILQANLLFSSSSLLLYNGAPYTMSVGGCYDLLDTSIPIGRSYSGVYANKEKKEGVFYHDQLQDNTAIENAALGIRINRLKGIRFGVFGTFLTVPSFDNLDERGVLISKIEAYDFIIGGAAIFDGASLNVLPYRVKEKVVAITNNIATENQASGEVQNITNEISESSNIASVLSNTEDTNISSLSNETEISSNESGIEEVAIDETEMEEEVYEVIPQATLGSTVVYEHVTNGWYYFLRAFNFAANVNYYQTALDEITTRSLFFDINTAGRFVVPYIGMPKELISTEKIDRDKEKSLEKSLRRFEKTTNSLLSDEDLEEEIVLEGLEEAERELLKREKSIKEEYADKEYDIKTVHQRREDIYARAQRLDIDITPSFVSNLIKEVVGEVYALVGIARQTMEDNGKTLNESVSKDLKQNSGDIKLYTKKVSQSELPPEVMSNAKSLFEHYNRYMTKEYSRTGAQRSFSIMGVARVRTALEDDSWIGLSEEYYGTNLYASYLQQYNNFAVTEEPKAGDSIKIPDIRKVTADLKARDAEARQKGFEYYMVREGDTWNSIAGKTLGSEEKADFLKIYNEAETNEGYLSEGVEIRIPLQNYQSERRQKKVAFLTRKSEIDKATAEAKKLYPLTEIQEIYLDALIASYERRLSLFEQREAVQSSLDERMHALKSKVTDQITEVEISAADALKEIRKISLKREYDMLNATRELDKMEARKEYKQEERNIFRNLLLQIFKVKERMIEQMEEEEKNKKRSHIKEIENIYEQIRVVVERNYAVKEIELKQKAEEIEATLVLRDENEFVDESISNINETNQISNTNASETNLTEAVEDPSANMAASAIDVSQSEEGGESSQDEESLPLEDGVEESVPQQVVFDLREEIKKLRKEKRDEIDAIDEEENKEIDDIKERHKNKINEYDWELYLTHLIYKSSEERKNTLAVGASVENLGVPLDFGGGKESLPVAFKADLNYNFMDLEYNDMTLYVRYGFSEIESHVLGFGVRYRIANFFELGAGGVYRQGVLLPTWGGAIMFNMGLINYRVDFGMHIEQNYGYQFAAGLNVLF